MLINVNNPLANNDDVLTVEEQSQIMEGIVLDNLTDSELLDFITDPQEVKENINNQVLTEKSIVRFDRAAKLSRAQKIAIFTIARKKKNPLFKKLLTLWRAERYIEARLAKLYGNQAMQQARRAVADASKRPSTGMKKVIDRAKIKAKRQLNAIGDVKAKAMVNKINF